MLNELIEKIFLYGTVICKILLKPYSLDAKMQTNQMTNKNEKRLAGPSQFTNYNSLQIQKQFLLPI